MRGKIQKGFVVVCRKLSSEGAENQQKNDEEKTLFSSECESEIGIFPGYFPVLTVLRFHVLGFQSGHDLKDVVG